MVLFLLFLIIICFFQIKSLKKDVRKLEELMLKHFLKQLDEKKSVKQSDVQENPSTFLTELQPPQKPLFVLPETEECNPFKNYEEDEKQKEENTPIDTSVQLFQASTKPTDCVISTPIHTEKEEKIITTPIASNSQTTQKSQNPFHFFGAKLSSWIAGFAAILGTFYLVKYSLDNGFLSPAVRMILLTIGAVISLFAGVICYHKEHMANGKRIGQTLFGVGLSAFYFIAYALSKLYYFVPESFSFILMCLTTVLCIACSLRFGILIAFLGTIGGFLTPLIASTEATSAFWITTYLIVLSLSILILAYRLESFALSVFSLIASYAWIIFWTIYSYHPYDSVWFFILLIVQVAYLGIYLLRHPNLSIHWQKLFHMGLIGLFVFNYLFLLTTNFGTTEWVLVILSSIFAVILGWYKTNKYGIYTAINFILTYCLMFIWTNPSTTTFKPIISIIIALIYFIPAYYAYWTTRRQILFPIYYIGLPIYLLGYYFMFETIYVALFGLCAIVPLLFSLISSMQESNKSLSGQIVLSTTAIITSGLAFLLPISYWSLVLISELLIYIGLNKQQKFDYLKIAQYVLLALYLLFSAHFILIGLWILIVGSDPYKYEKLFSTGLPSFNFWLSYIILPIITYALLRRNTPGEKLKTAISYLLGFTIITATTFGYSLIVETIKLATNSYDSIRMLSLNIGDIALITNLIFLVSTLAYYFKKKGLAKPLFIVACIRLGVETIQVIDRGLLESPIIFWIYGVPLVFFIINTIIAENKQKLLIWNVIYSFGLTSMIINYLFGNASASTELIGYSVGWFILGIIWLVMGLYHKLLIKPAFGLIYIVVAKIFIWDVASASSLIRILALFCLAGCMLGLSWLYSKLYKVSE